jgi:hypothetical protein
VRFPLYRVSFPNVSVNLFFPQKEYQDFKVSYFFPKLLSLLTPYIRLITPFPRQLTMSHSNLTGTDGRGKWYGNLTLILDPELCTVKTCDLSLASFLYIPSLPGNAIYAAIFALYIAAQLFLGIKYKTWGYMTALVLGLALEVFGYVARIMLHNDPFNNNDFLMYLVALTIAPALLSASVSY